MTFMDTFGLRTFVIFETISIPKGYYVKLNSGIIQVLYWSNAS